MDMILISFTKKGAVLGARIEAALADETIRQVRIGHAAENEGENAGDANAAFMNDAGRCASKRTLAEAVAEAFRTSQPLVFIGATGIAVRAIAPHLADKRTDPPVLVLDDSGRFVIPLVSGHLGGANALAGKIAGAIAAVPVVTTATDGNDAFAVDLFAQEQNLGIVNRDGIAKVSSKALEGKPVTLSVQGFPPKEPVDVLVVDGSFDTDDLDVSGTTEVSDDQVGAASYRARGVMPVSPLLQMGAIVLTARNYVLGIGCRKGKDAETIRACAERALAAAGIAAHDVAAIASVDVKAEEPGITALSRRWHVPFLTFDAELLAQAEGATASSDFVKRTVGVDNVCERAALLASGAGAELVLSRQVSDGVTVAIARRTQRKRTEKKA